jgi:hypothetical protein
MIRMWARLSVMLGVAFAVLNVAARAVNDTPNMRAAHGLHNRV